MQKSNHLRATINFKRKKILLWRKKSCLAHIPASHIWKPSSSSSAAAFSAACNSFWLALHKNRIHIPVWFRNLSAKSHLKVESNFSCALAYMLKKYANRARRISTTNKPQTKNCRTVLYKKRPCWSWVIIVVGVFFFLLVSSNQISWNSFWHGRIDILISTHLKKEFRLCSIVLHVNLICIRWGNHRKIKLTKF